MKNKTTFLCVLTFSVMMITNRIFAQSAKTQTNDHTLETSRQKIDSLDKQLIKILGKREQVVREIGIYKAKNNIPSLQSDRFQQVLKKGIEEGSKEGLSSTFITELLNAIHKESLRIEDEIKAKK